VFTGIVEERGTVVEDGPRLAVEARTVGEGTRVGDSVSVNGVCLTVADRSDGILRFDVTSETVARTTLGSLRPGAPVNLERPVTLATRLDGHLVQGHVDGVATVEAMEHDGSGATLRIRVDDALARYLVEKGSVALDGVSLTVASIDGTAFTVALVPRTLEVTTLGRLRPGDGVNVEVDVLAKYVQALLGRTT
jgi:riboflavin synthase